MVTKFVSKNAPKGKEDVPIPVAGDIEGARNTLPAKYGDKDTTPLSADIKAGDNDFTFDLATK